MFFFKEISDLSFLTIKLLNLPCIPSPEDNLRSAFLPTSNMHGSLPELQRIEEGWPKCLKDEAYMEWIIATKMNVYAYFRLTNKVYIKAWISCWLKEILFGYVYIHNIKIWWKGGTRIAEGSFPCQRAPPDYEP